MNPAIIFTKTSRGQDVIKKRARGLGHSLRLALILVDGHSSVNQLKLKAMTMNNLEKSLEVLALNGLIQANSDSWQIIKDNPAVIRRASSNPEISKIKARLIDAAILILGDEAHRVINLIRETSDSPQALSETVNRCKKIILLTLDEDRAKELNDLCHSILRKVDSVKQ
ncbi:hypothetical protein MNBD_GAMMA21-2190 [hydrothermal vent metagenome]|uniref:Uncharacterized protein n=1 Tax=hydrothermal vent metagenome TaxID=652676 RepID=A0A3B1AWV7_9ZZZZ